MTLRLLEELSLNALPALQTLHYDGWELRFSSGAGGYPRRANSIQLIYPSLLPLDEKIDFCEAAYRARGQKTVFKVTLAAPDGLDAALRSRAYELDCITSVKTLDLARFDAQPETLGIEVVIETAMSADWAADNARLHGENPARSEVINTILERLVVDSAFVRLRRNGETIALGRGALDQGWIAPYEIVVDERYRQQGLGRTLMLALLQWGKNRGATNAYLQVMTDNAPAVRLYEMLGFREEYTYWYLQTPAKA
ncbi:MAG: GNAT family N-acetyltransferase [Chloroflexota bacterium]